MVPELGEFVLAVLVDSMTDVAADLTSVVRVEVAILETVFVTRPGLPLLASRTLALLCFVAAFTAEQAREDGCCAACRTTYHPVHSFDRGTVVRKTM